jgi:hypothetical protein
LVKEYIQYIDSWVSCPYLIYSYYIYIPAQLIQSLARFQTALLFLIVQGRQQGAVLLASFTPIGSVYNIPVGMTSGGSFRYPRIVLSCQYNKETTILTDLLYLSRRYIQEAPAILCITNCSPSSTALSLYICTGTAKDWEVLQSQPAPVLYRRRAAGSFDLQYSSGIIVQRKYQGGLIQEKQLSAYKLLLPKYSNQYR